jgi:alkaline phosphatase D
MKHIVLLASLTFTSLFAKPPIPTPPEVPVLGEIEPWLFKNILNAKDADGSLAKVHTNPGFLKLVKKHKLRLFGGPMLSSVTDKSAVVWLRTPQPETLQLTVKDGSAKTVASVSAKTSIVNDLTVKIAVNGLSPLTGYTYTLADSQGEIPIGNAKFRTAPTKGQKATIRVAFGGGSRYNHPKEYIWDTVAKQDPDIFLFLGDNLYQDDPLHRNLQRVYYYRRQLRPEYQRLTASTAIYAIWDDHDFGKNDCAGGLDPFKPDWKVPVWKVFKENWANPGFGNGPKQPGCWFKFSHGDIDFFMTDGRYYRDFKKGTMLGPVQKQWLLESLKDSTATFKVIASGTLWTETADKGGKDSWWGVRKEREEILSLIDTENIGGVLLLSADRHRTDVYQIKRPNGYTLYEFETSKLTNNHTHGTKEQALFSYNKGNFFGTLDFELGIKDPTVTFRCITIEGEEVYELPLKRSQLQRD